MRVTPSWSLAGVGSQAGVWEPAVKCVCRARLQTGIDASGSSALGRIAGNIQEIALFLAFRACVRGLGCGKEKPALAAFPERQPTLRTDIPLESSIRGITAVSTGHVLSVITHLLLLSFICTRSIPTTAIPRKYNHQGMMPSLPRCILHCLPRE